MNVMHRFNEIKNEIEGKSIQELFSSDVWENWDFNSIQPGCCIYCGHKMSRDEMFPRDRVTPRAMHDQCFRQVIMDNRYSCIICGDVVDTSMISRRNQNPYDIHNLIHDGRKSYSTCMDFLALMSAKACGIDTGVYDERQMYSNANARRVQPVRRAIAAPKTRRPALPIPEDQISPSNYIDMIPENDSMVYSHVPLKDGGRR
jgi:hypothetical protein